MGMRRLATIIIWAIVSVIMLTIAAHATIADWNGNTDSWNNAGNWLPIGVPNNSSFDVNIGINRPSNFPQVTLSGSYGVGSLSIAAGYGLTVKNGAIQLSSGPSTGALTNYGTIRLGSEGNYGGILFGGNSNNYGNITLGSVTLGGGSCPGEISNFNPQANLNNNTGGTISGSGYINTAITNYGTVTANSYNNINLSNYGLIIDYRIFTNSIGGFINVGSSNDLIANLYFNTNASLINNGTINVYGNLENRTNSALNLTAPGGYVYMQGGSIKGNQYNNGNLSGYGTINGNLTNSGIVTANSDNALNIKATLNNSSNAVINVGTNDNHIGNLDFSGGSLNNSGILNIYGRLNNNNTFGTYLTTSSSSNAYLQGGTISGSGGFYNMSNLRGYGTISAALTNYGSLNVYYGTYSTPQTLTISNALTNNGSVYVNQFNKLILSGSLSGTGKITIGSGGTFSNNTASALDLINIILAGGVIDGPQGYNNSSSGVWSSGYGSINAPLFNNGTINVNSSLTIGGSLNGNGIVNVEGGTLNNNTGSIMDLGKIYLKSGTLTGSHGFINSSTYNYDYSYGDSYIESPLTNAGIINDTTSNNSKHIFGLNIRNSLINNNGSIFNIGNNTNVSSYVNFSTSNSKLINHGTLNIYSKLLANTSSIITLTESDGDAYLYGGIINSSNGGSPIGGFKNDNILSGYGTIGTTLINNGTVTSTSDNALNITGALTNSNIGILKVGTGDSPTSTMSFSSNGSLTNYGTVKVYGTLNNNNSTPLNLTAAGGYAYLNGGTLNGTGGFKNDHNLSGYGTISAPLTNNGTLTVSGGTSNTPQTLNMSNPNFTNNGTVAIQQYNTFNNNSSADFNLGGVVNLQGGNLASSSGKAYTTNNLSGYGTISAPLTNTGTATFTGGTSTVSGELTNNNGANLNIQTNPASFNTVTNNGIVNVNNATATFGSVTNSGTVNVNNATVTWGNFTNDGAYVSDPSTQTFNNLTVGTNGYIQAAAGDVYLIKGDFLNSSNMKALWDTTVAKLGFISGTSTAHTLSITGADMGRTYAGYNANFAWNTLDLAGQMLTLKDGDNTAGGAFYVGQIAGLTFSDDHKMITDIASIAGLNIYYNPTLNSDLGGRTYNLTTGGTLAPVPLPPSVYLFGTGLVGLIGLRRFKRS